MFGSLYIIIAPRNQLRKMSDVIQLQDRLNSYLRENGMCTYKINDDAELSRML